MVPLKRPESYPSRDPNPCMRREHSRIPIYPKSQRRCKWGGHVRKRVAKRAESILRNDILDKRERMERVPVGTVCCMRARGQIEV